MAGKAKAKVRKRSKVRDLEPKRGKDVKGGTIGMQGSSNAANSLATIGNQATSTGGSRI